MQRRLDTLVAGHYALSASCLSNAHGLSNRYNSLYCQMNFLFSRSLSTEKGDISKFFSQFFCCRIVIDYQHFQVTVTGHSGKIKNVRFFSQPVMASWRVSLLFEKVHQDYPM
ncbi:hypothetical protein NB643_03850 [Oxalobacter aliiformigenes]|uniref:Uncharacterized protein n=1 Tax=Oxalobacter aliiformigenes TaxID=2946593 RepID=A0ABY7JGB8_9BURK|nr:hypothetical protein [Oxalobacter aliiformigenes]WAV92602.1 hypothetical protein NB641_07265 [Oxalobacter aliiformigenes]WAV95890.1 hypothetical protein NB643_03850 [Oxalobacter aliiformigenes]WAV96318.1 hypothetical protein NB645_05555 [Oxalobacter aliiformigenes]